MSDASRVAIVHDWLVAMRGGEKVLEALCEIHPRAHVYTLVHAKGSVSPALEAMDIRTSWIQRLPLSPRRFRSWLPLFPAAIESFDLRAYDLVISSSHCVAKGVVPAPGAVHVSYVHTPMRYAWDLGPEYFHPSRSGPLLRMTAPLVASALRTWDAAASPRVDLFLANSAHVADRIRRYYGRDSAVVHPPVDTRFYTPAEAGASRRHLLVVSALVPYKAIELALAAVRGLGLELIVVGEGSERRRLEALAPPNVRFAGSVSAVELRELYRGARAFLLPGEEDFGIAAVEAQAAGAPVVAYARGGALESVVDGRTGALFDEPSPEALRKAIDRVLLHPLNMEDLRANAARFSRERFLAEVRLLIEDARAGRTRPAAGRAGPPSPGGDDA